LDSAPSRLLIPHFVRRNGIDLSQYLQRRYTSFNDFFTRQIDPACRPIDQTPESLISPCDSRLSVYPIDETQRFFIKNTEYTVAQLLQNDALAQQLKGGLALVFRLCVDDYHRYCYFDDCSHSGSRAIAGVLHTVRPVAMERRRVLTENSREVTVLHTAHFGTAVQVEVGALLVGRIKNLHPGGRFVRGAEKGMFEFGGSTVVLLLQPGVRLREDLWQAMARQEEIRVKQGEVIGFKE